jgi:hypothetical protein
VLYLIFTAIDSYKSGTSKVYKMVINSNKAKLVVIELKLVIAKILSIPCHLTNRYFSIYKRR